MNFRYRSFKRQLLFVGLFAIAAPAFAQVAQCPAGHCSGVGPVVYQFCKENNAPTTKMPVQGPDGNFCWCGCSCVDESTFTFAYVTDPKLSGQYPPYLPVLDLVKNLSPGQPLFTPTAGYSPVDKVMRTDDSGGEELMIVAFNNGQQLTVSKNHTFISKDDRIVAAKELEIGQRLRSGKTGKSVKVTSLETTTERKKLYNVILNSKSAFPEDHLWFTNGIWSGDWVVQSAKDLLDTEIRLRSPDLAPLLQK